MTTEAKLLLLLNCLMVIAVLLAPMVAVRTQRKLDRRRSRDDRRTELFRTLMGTRGARLSPAHVHALNMIDLEFYGVKSIRDAWKEYLDHLVNGPEESDQPAMALWYQGCDTMLVNLLYEMSRFLRYDFDKPHLKRAFYTPKAFGDEESIHRGIRFALARFLTGNHPLPVKLVENDPTPTGGTVDPDTASADVAERLGGERSEDTPTDSDPDPV